MIHALEQALRESKSIRYTLKPSVDVPSTMRKLDVCYYFVEEVPGYSSGIKKGAIYDALGKPWPEQQEGRTFVLKFRPELNEHEFREHRQLLFGFMISICSNIELI